MSGGLNGSTQPWLAVYLPESQIPTSFAVVDLSAARPCRVLLESSRTGRFLSGSTVAAAHSCFRRCRAASGSGIAEVHFHIRGHREAHVLGHLQSAILVESCKPVGVPAGLRFRFLRSAFSVFVFAFHVLPDLMRIVDERVRFWAHSLRPVTLAFCDTAPSKRPLHARHGPRRTVWQDLI
jgi:hypothetical protein